MSGIGIRSLLCGTELSDIFEMFLHSCFEVSVCVSYVYFACVFAFHTVHHYSVSANVVVVTAFGPFGSAVAR